MSETKYSPNRGLNFKALSSTTKRLISGPKIEINALQRNPTYSKNWDGAYLRDIAGALKVTISAKASLRNLHFTIKGPEINARIAIELLTNLDHEAGLIEKDHNLNSFKDIQSTDYKVVSVHLEGFLKKAKTRLQEELKQRKEIQLADVSNDNTGEPAGTMDVFVDKMKSMTAPVNKSFNTSAKGKGKQAGGPQAKIIAPDPLEPRNISQAIAYTALRDPDVSVAFLVGPAGGGKTYVPTHFALEEMSNGNFEKLYLFRPRTVTGGKDMGAFPGGPNAKMEFYVKVFSNKVKEITGQALPRNAVSIEGATPDGERGETYTNAIVLVDEAQNLTLNEATMLLTRLGEGTKFIITGDISNFQNDLKGQHPGLAHLIATQASAVNRNDKVLGRGTAFVRFTEEDSAARHPMLPNILRAFNNPDEEYAAIMAQIESNKQNSGLAKAIAEATKYANRHLELAASTTYDKYIGHVRTFYPSLYPQGHGNVSLLHRGRERTADIA